MDRVCFLIDGFNLYHSLKDAGRETRWLDLNALCRSYLHLLGKEAHLEKIYYFSALAKHLEARKPDVTRRHRSYLECLHATGVRTELNRFKAKKVHCPGCRLNFTKYEEKETDVALALGVVRLFIQDQCDTAVIVTGDTDVAPAVRLCNEVFPTKRVLFAFPYRRKNNELAKLCPGSFTISREQYWRHQFSDPFVLPSGRAIHKPVSW